MCETLHGIKYKSSMNSEEREMEVVSRAFIWLGFWDENSNKWKDKSKVILDGRNSMNNF